MAYQPYQGGTPPAQQSNAWALLSLFGNNQTKPTATGKSFANANELAAAKTGADRFTLDNLSTFGNTTFSDYAALQTPRQQYLNTLAQANSPANKPSSMSY